MLTLFVVGQKINDTNAFILTSQSHTIVHNTRYAHPPHTRDSILTGLQLANNNEDEYDTDPRDNFGRSLRGLQSSALKTQIDVGDTVVCKLSMPSEYVYIYTICMFV